jgi:hypothetical protein
MTSPISDELRELHDDYVQAVNEAVAEDDLRRVEMLVSEYYRDAMTLMVSREGLPIVEPRDVNRHGPGRVRRLARRLTLSRAA